MLQHADRALVNGGEDRLSQHVGPCLRATDEAPARLLPLREIAFKPLVRSSRQKCGETGVVMYMTTSCSVLGMMPPFYCRGRCFSERRGATTFTVGRLSVSSFLSLRVLGLGLTRSVYLGLTRYLSISARLYSFVRPSFALNAILCDFASMRT